MILIDSSNLTLARAAEIKFDFKFPFYGEW